MPKSTRKHIKLRGQLILVWMVINYMTRKKKKSLNPGGAA